MSSKFRLTFSWRHRCRQGWPTTTPTRTWTCWRSGGKWSRSTPRMTGSGWCRPSYGPRPPGAIGKTLDLSCHPGQWLIATGEHFSRGCSVLFRERPLPQRHITARPPVVLAKWLGCQCFLCLVDGLKINSIALLTWGLLAVYSCVVSMLQKSAWYCDHHSWQYPKFGSFSHRHLKTTHLHSGSFDP